MTTIVASVKEGVMVSDSRCTGGETWVPMTKVLRIGDGLFGFAGSINERDKWLKWHRSGRRGARPKLENFVALHLKPDGLYEISADGLEMLIERGFHAVGSGGAAALGAMLAGSEAKKAVEIACQIDTGSGGDICVFNLRETI